MEPAATREFHPGRIAIAAKLLTYLCPLQSRNCAIVLVANLPGDFTAAFDLDLAIGNLPRHPTARPDEQTPSHNEITVKRSLYIGILRRAFSGEHASLLDNHIRAVG